MPSYEQLITWRTDNWDDLARVWKELVGTLTDSYYIPTFNGEEISSQEAGYVFQTWIIEAFRLSIADPRYSKGWQYADIGRDFLSE